MLWQSTNKQIEPVTLSQAIQSGLASDGGLFMPTEIPRSQLTDDLPYPEFVVQCLMPYFQDDLLADFLPEICHTAFNFPLPLHHINDHTTLLELFHGPTLAFKDFGARFLAECMQHIPATGKQQLIIVATSGDTGSAVASAFYQKPNTQVVVLYPQGQITARQEAQITCWGDNILALAVEGSFDDCQQMAKSAFQDNDITSQWQLSSANSINAGRLLPQVVYYAYATVQLARNDIVLPTIIVPSGNLGNVTAAHLAKHMGFAIGDIVAVTNANQALTDFCQTGEFKARPSIPTLANAMDVGNPSNFARLQALYPAFADFTQHVPAVSVDDQQIEAAITDCYQRFNTVLCPHTATAWHAAQQLTDDKHHLIAATAHPCKFETIVEPLLDVQIPLPEIMQTLLAKPTQLAIIPATLEAVKSHLR